MGSGSSESMHRKKSIFDHPTMFNHQVVVGVAENEGNWSGDVTFSQTSNLPYLLSLCATQSSFALHVPGT